MGADPDARLLVPVKRSVTLRGTVGYAVAEAAEAVADGSDVGSDVAIHFVYLATWRAGDPGTDAERRRAEALLEQVEVWVRYDLEEAGVEPEAVDVATAVVGDEDYIYSPSAYAEALTGYARENGLGRVVVDPEYTLVGHTSLLGPLEFELSQTDLAVEEAPVERPTRRGRLVGGTSRARFAALFGTSFVFYQILGGFAGLFDVVTGAATALVVALSLSSVSFNRDPSLAETPKRILRWAVYTPYLIWEIVKSNVVVAKVILDPRMPIDPRLTRVRAHVGPGLPITTLANSITLTPGTLTVRATDQQLYVHSLLPWAREGLFGGDLERWVRFVFYGREAANFASPRERGDAEVLQEPVAADGVEAIDGAAEDHPGGDGS